MQTNKGMTCHAAKTDHNSGMLDRVILIEQSGTDNADLFPLAEAKHLLKQARGNDLGIVV